ncbi:MAG: prepilin-type N-terminal cleavage/methylation domain-containing protein [Lentisphaeraceae bacterium]|nr:prepilin-type N-terminal cleavage/methylation domain-containing protein [Lentisphaeraceae bacterium]
MNKRKFTLIELLVVISIIGILLTILLPSLTKARNKAEQAVCLSNQKQLGIAAYTFSGENNKKLPSLRNGPQSTDIKAAWKSQMSPYILSQYYAPNDKELTKGPFRCPTSLTTIAEVYSPLMRQAGGIAYNGYGLRNEYVNALGSSTGTENAAFLATVLQANETFLTSDSTDSYNPRGDLLVIFLPSRSQQKSPTRHNYGGVSAFVDGHARFIKYSSMEAGKNGDRDFYLRRDKDKAWGSN